MDPIHPTSLSMPQQRMSNFSTLLLPRAGTSLILSPSGEGGEYMLHCREHSLFPHPGWDRAHLQKDKGRWRRAMQELKEEETQPGKKLPG